MLTLTRKAFQRDTVQAAVTLLQGFADEAQIGLQVYQTFPTSINPPAAYPERVRERRRYSGIYLRERTVTVLIRVLFGLAIGGERGDAAWQKVDFVDGFSDYTESRFHAAGDNTAIALVSADDDPEFVVRRADGKQMTYFSTLLGLEGSTQN